jgi:hypothetical protein
MKFVLVSLLMTFTMALPLQAQTLIAEEDFEGGAGDWVDVDRNAVTYNASGGQDGGAYISMTGDIDTSSNGQFGGYVLFRCAVAPSQLPSQDCSNGAFVGDWYFTEGIQQLTFWIRHNSTKSGGWQPTIRVAVPGNQIGGSGIFAAVPANTWSQVVLNIDPQDPAWDPNWGALYPNAVQILRNIGRLQPGFYDDPANPDYSESNVTFDIDDVQMLGSPSITVVVDQKGTLHPRHNGGPDAVADLNDSIPMIVYGASTGAGDPVDLDTDDIVASSVRMGKMGGGPTGTAVYNLDDDNDGVEDARFRALSGDVGMSCSPAWNTPTELALRAELITGEIIAGLDTSLVKNCDAQCH